MFQAGFRSNTGILKTVNITRQLGEVVANVLNISVFSCRHVLDDSSGWSSEDDRKGLQHRRLGEDRSDVGTSSALRCQVQTKPPTSGYQPRDKGRGWGGAARPGDVVESRSQNQDPAGAGGRGHAWKLQRSALCNADQVLQTGTEIQTDT